jgi:hypothetical protein
MANLAVDPRYLEDLANLQEQASKGCDTAAKMPGEIGKSVWISHGVITHAANDAVDAAEKARQKAADGVISVAASLAAKLRAARQIYEDVDEDLSDNLDKQMLDR